MLAFETRRETKMRQQENNSKIMVANSCNRDSWTANIIFNKCYRKQIIKSERSLKVKTLQNGNIFSEIICIFYLPVSFCIPTVYQYYCWHEQVSSNYDFIFSGWKERFLLLSIINKNDRTETKNYYSAASNRVAKYSELEWFLITI